MALIAHSHLILPIIGDAFTRCRKSPHSADSASLNGPLSRIPLYPHASVHLRNAGKYYPEVFEELREKIANGQFEPVGAMYVEPDCNIPAAESLIRQCLYGQQYFREKFGKTIHNCWLPDVFGNSWILPQILKKAALIILFPTKCLPGTTPTVSRTTTLSGKALTAAKFMPACRRRTLSLEYAEPDSGKLGSLSG